MQYHKDVGARQSVIQLILNSDKMGERRDNNI